MYRATVSGDGSLETHEHAMRRLAASLKLADGDLFNSPAELAEWVCALQGARIAYVKRVAGDK